MNQTVNQVMSQLSYRTGASPLVGSLWFPELCCNWVSQPFQHFSRTTSATVFFDFWLLAADRKACRMPLDGPKLSLQIYHVGFP